MCTRATPSGTAQTPDSPTGCPVTARRDRLSALSLPTPYSLPRWRCRCRSLRRRRCCWASLLRLSFECRAQVAILSLADPCHAAKRHTTPLSDTTTKHHPRVLSTVLLRATSSTKHHYHATRHNDTHTPHHTTRAPLATASAPHGTPEFQATLSLSRLPPRLLLQVPSPDIDGAFEPTTRAPPGEAQARVDPSKPVLAGLAFHVQCAAAPMAVTRPRTALPHSDRPRPRDALRTPRGGSPRNGGGRLGARPPPTLLSVAFCTSRRRAPAPSSCLASRSPRPAPRTPVAL